MRKPLETLYGYDYFAKTCEKWVDGILQFKHLPDGRSREPCHRSLAGYRGCSSATSAVPKLLREPPHGHPEVRTAGAGAARSGRWSV